ncbi:hypothetical protein [Azonexus hydrophilus]|uniref:Uncharacterized protein n=1 Tax=Azonexus hydrophilus TaxID=418702 RepID=A0ABZ2XFL3_9RHOO
MTRDLMRVADAIDRAKGVNAGLDALVCLMMGCNEADIPRGRPLAELIYSIHRDMTTFLDEAERGLRK